MTVLEQDLKTIKTIIMQHRGAYYISKNDYAQFIQAIKRVNIEAAKISSNE